METSAICPECSRGDHDACPGSAWCAATSFPSPCDCADTDHTEGLF